MRFLLWINRHLGVYLAFSVLLVMVPMVMVGWLANRDINAEREVPLAEALGSYAAALESGTVNSRAMGATILFGLENSEARQLALGKLPPDAPEVLSALNTLRTLYFTDTAFLVNRQGVIAAYSGKNGTHDTGRDLSSRPNVQLAMRGTPNVYPALDSNSNERGIYLAAPVRTALDDSSAPIGAVVVKVGANKLDSLLKSWSGGAAVLLSPQGVVFAASRKDWLFHIAGAVSTDWIAEIQRSQQFGQVISTAPLPFTANSPETSIDGMHYVLRSLALEWNDPKGDWMLVLLDQRDPWWTRWKVAGYATLAGLFFFALLFWLYSLARMTGRRQADLRVMEVLQGQMRELTDNAPVAVFQMLPDTDRRRQSQFFSHRVKDILGVDAETIMAQRGHMFDHVPAEERVTHQARLDECMAKGTGWNIEFRIILDGETRWIQSVAYALQAENGAMHYNGFIEDVTARKMMAEEMSHAREIAEQAARVKSDFLANMSHEIRTPMNAIIGLSHLALKTELTPRQLDYLKKIQQSGQHLLGIINDILDFSKIEAGKMSTEHVPLALENVLDNVANLIGEKAGAKGLELVFKVARDVPMHLVGDPLRLGQILINYASNAVKFTERGEIDILVSKREESDSDVLLHFAVHDTGIGMTPGQINHLFQSFHQADTSTTRQYGGTGLGLAICKDLAALMGGEVGVDSTPGVGTTFWFTVRFGKSAEVSRRARLRAELEHRHVLVVDDNKNARDVLIDLLEEMNLRATAVDSGNAAIQAIRDAEVKGHPFEIVFLDWQMPEMNGVETARAIAELGLTRSPHLVMVTAYGREEVIKSMQDAGIEDILIKPVSSSLLYNAVMQVLSGDDSDSSVSVEESLSSKDMSSIRGALVLLVEDNELNQQVACELLEYIGLKVEMAENGEVAVKKAREKTYDIVLMDMQMPVMDGLEATRLIRKLPLYAELPILAMTANVMQADRDRCSAAGMNDYLSKPIEPDELWQALLKWIRPRDGLGGDVVNVPAAPVETRTNGQIPANIAGLDTALGLRRVLGKPAQYMSMLRQFAAGQRDFAATINNALDSNDLHSAERFAHTLKGVAGNIGAMPLHDAAGELETALREARPGEEVNEYLAATTTLLTNLLTALDQALPGTATEEQAHVNVDHAELQQVCQKLYTLLVRDDPEACDVFTEHSQLLKAALGKNAQIMESAIGYFEFDLALETLQKAASQSNVALS